MLTGGALPPIVGETLKMFREYMTSNGYIGIYLPRAALKISFCTNGIAEVYDMIFDNDE